MTRKNTSMKDHTKKLRVDLIPPRGIEEMAKVMMDGIRPGKYAEGDWKNVPVEQHVAAAMRHILKIQQGELLDESGLLHADHAATDMLLAAENLRLENNDPTKDVMPKGMTINGIGAGAVVPRKD